MSDEPRSGKVIRFCEKYLVVPEGQDVGKPVRLREWQRDIIRQIYDTPTRQAIVSMPRKQGKTALCAMLVLAHVIGPEAQRNAQVFSAAQSRQQAGIVFDLAAKMVRMSKELSDPNLVVVRDHAKELFSPYTGARYRALAAEASTTFGLSPAIVIHDELGQVRGPRSELYDALETAMGAHPHPLSIVISTQAPTSSDLLSLLIDYARTGADPKTKLVFFGADETDPLDDPATWAKANPALGDFLNETEIAGLAVKAMRMPAFEAAFRNLHLNQRVSAQANLLSAGVWAANGGEPDMEAFERGPVFGGLDLSSRQDLTALVLVAAGEDGNFNVWPHFWTPASTVVERAQRDRAPYDLWASQGKLSTVPGQAIDYAYVAHRLGELCRDFPIEQINFDRWRIAELRAAIAASGIDDICPLVEFGQGFKDMAPALDVLESVALQERLRHGMHPVLTMCASNAVVVADPAGNRKLDKAKASGRIDGLVALVMALAAATQQEDPALNVRALIG